MNEADGWKLTPKRLIALGVLVVVLSLLAGGGSAWVIANTSAGSPVQYFGATTSQNSSSVGTLVPASVSQSEASVVTIETQPQTLQMFLSGNTAGVVHGFIATSSGIVITSSSAVYGATMLRVITTAGQSYDATLLATDASAGIVALQLSGTPNAVPLSIAGQAAISGAAGYVLYPSEAQSQVTAVGAVQTVGEQESFHGQSVSGVDVLGTQSLGTADGVPVLDSAGNVLGVVFANFDTPTVGAGLPFVGSDVLSHFLASLTGSGSQQSATFGATSVLVTPTLGALLDLPSGALITSVETTGCAAQAGIHVGDVVESVNGVDIGGPVQFDAARLGLAPGSTVVLRYVREGALLQATCVISAQ